MTIEIATQSIVEDMRIKSHLEAQRIQSPQERNDARIDEDDMDEVNRDIVFASSSLARIVQRFLDPDSPILSGGALSVAETIEYDLDFSTRREAGKAQQLHDAFHAYIVDSALSKFFRSVSQFELSKAHDEKAKEEEADIIRIINYKSAPTWQD